MGDPNVIFKKTESVKVSEFFLISLVAIFVNCVALSVLRLLISFVISSPSI